MDWRASPTTHRLRPSPTMAFRSRTEARFTSWYSSTSTCSWRARRAALTSALPSTRRTGSATRSPKSNNWCTVNSRSYASKSVATSRHFCARTFAPPVVPPPPHPQPPHALQALLRADLRVLVGSRPDNHRLREGAIARSIDNLILGARDGAQHVAQIQGRIPEVAIVLQVEPRKLVLQEFNGLRPVDQPWVRQQRQSVVKTANDVQAECVECADPHRRRRDRIAGGNPLAQFIGRL